MNARITTTVGNREFGIVEYLFWSVLAITALADFSIGYALGLYWFDALYLVPFSIYLVRFVSNHVIANKIPYIEKISRVLDWLTILCSVAYVSATVLLVLFLMTQEYFELWQLLTPVVAFLKMIGISLLFKAYWNRH